MKAAAISLAASLILAAPCAAQWWWPPTNGLSVQPSGCRGPTTELSLTLSGQWPDSCKPNFITAIVAGTDIDLTTVVDPPPVGCLTVITNWTQTASIGAIPVGTYSVYATHRVAGNTIHPRTLVGSITISASCCYANCDESTSPPILNALDFGCFLTKWAAGDPYANCDGSWNPPPILNALDFSCFLTKFAAGCT